MDLPMPNEFFFESKVVASMWLNDSDEDYPISYRVLLLNPEAPYYTVAEVADNETSYLKNFENIVDATAYYND